MKTTQSKIATLPQLHVNLSLFTNKKPHSSRDQLFLNNIKKIINENLDNEYFDAGMLARQVYLSISQLNRRLNYLTGQSAGLLIRTIRLFHAAKLLANNTAPIGEIAFEVGFANQASFCRSFKRQFGCPPSKYVKQYYKWKMVSA